MPIFGIGLPKTGSYSLSRACEILGFPTDHDYQRNVERCRQLRTGALSSFKSGHAYFDGLLWSNYPLIRACYPQAKFIWHVRADRDQWINSQLIHCLHNRLHGEDWRNVSTRDADREWDEFEDLSRQANPLGDRQSLVVDLSRGDEWGQLCRFLGKPVPNVDFPRQNTGRWRLEQIVEFYRRHDVSGRDVASQAP